MVTNKTRAFASACIGICHRPVRLAYKPYFFSQRTIFFSHNKSANGIFSHGLSAKHKKNTKDLTLRI